MTAETLGTADILKVLEALPQRSAGELAELVHTGKVSAVELTSACLERIDALEPRIGAFTHIAHELALAAAAEVCDRRVDARRFVRDARGLEIVHFVVVPIR